MSNITSSPSVGTRASVWFRSIPLVTRVVFAICVIIRISEYLFGTIHGTVCLIPGLVIYEKEIYRIVTPIWFHGGILHLVLNMMAFLPMGTTIERSMLGSLSFAHLILLFDLLCGVIHVVLAALLFYNPFLQYPEYTFQCNVGLSSVIFGLLTISCYQSPNSNRSIFGFFSVPAKIYPWALLVILQFIMPGISFLGHLSGILSGVLYVYGYLNIFLLSNATLSKIESSLGWIVMRDGYITNPGLGAPSSNSSLPSRSSNNDNSPGLFTRLSNMIPSRSPSSSSGTFSGNGYVLGTNNNNSQQ